MFEDERTVLGGTVEFLFFNNQQLQLFITIRTMEYELYGYR